MQIPFALVAPVSPGELKTFAAASPSGGNDSFTKSLLDLESDLTDSNTGGSAKTWSSYGTAAIASPPVPSPFGTVVLSVPASSYLDTPDSADWDFSGDYCVDVWVYANSGSTSGLPNGVVTKCDPPTTYGPVNLIQVNTQWKFYSSSSGASWDIASNKIFGAVDVGQWTHLEIDRSGNTYYIFKNGILAATWTSALVPLDNAFPIAVGAGWNTGSVRTYLNGYIKEFRFSTKARHTANFSPPQAPYSTGVVSVASVADWINDHVVSEPAYTTVNSNPGGPFTVTTGWTPENASSALSVQSGSLRVAETGGAAAPMARTSFTTVVQGLYRVTIDVLAASSTTDCRYRIGSTAGGGQFTGNGTYGMAFDGKVIHYFTATTTTSYVEVGSASLVDGQYTDFPEVCVERITGVLTKVAPFRLMRRGVSVHHAMNWAEQTDGIYSIPPFSSAGYALTDTMIQQIADAGFDHIRLTLEPGPFIQLTGTDRDDLDDILMDRVNRIKAKGMSVILDFHPISNVAAYHTEILVNQGTRATLFNDFKAAIVRTAQLLPGDGTCILEFVNEPYSAPNGAYQGIVETIYYAVRAVAPKLPVIMSSPSNNVLINPTFYKNDPLAFWTFHEYNTVAFTHQSGADILYPAGGLTRAAMEAHIETFVTYFNSYAMPLHRIYTGELGVIRTYGIWTGAPESSRIAWLTDVRELLEIRGIPWAIWTYHGFGGMTIIISDADPEAGIDPNTLSALGLP